LYEVARTHGITDAVGQDLIGLLAALDANPELEAALASPLVVPRKKKATVDALVATARDTTKEVGRLLSMLAERDRFNLVRQIAAEYRSLAMEAGQVVEAEIVTAVPIAQAQKAKLADALGRATGGQVELVDRVDPNIIAGVIATVGGVVYDGSAVRQMELMKKTLVRDA